MRPLHLAPFHLPNLSQPAQPAHSPSLARQPVAECSQCGEEGSCLAQFIQVAEECTALDPLVGVLLIEPMTPASARAL
jgi:hypothetical protein